MLKDIIKVKELDEIDNLEKSIVLHLNKKDLKMGLVWLTAGFIGGITSRLINGENAKFLTLNYALLPFVYDMVGAKIERNIGNPGVLGTMIKSEGSGIGYYSGVLATDYVLTSLIK